MTSGVVRRSLGASPSGLPVPEHPRVVTVGRPPWWALVLALLIAVWVTVDLLARGVTEQIDIWVSDTVGGWGLRDSDAYGPLYVVTRIGGQGTMQLYLFAVVAFLAGRHRTFLPLVRLLLAMLLLGLVVYSIKYGIGRTAPQHPGHFLHDPDGQSFPSGHVANAVLLWGVVRWQAVEYGMHPWVQRALWALAVVGPVLTTLSMVALDFHWVSDAVVGAAVGLLLLGVVHALDARVLSRWSGARPVPPTS
ncbi:phosphatase PAP2 family protein [Blastococcus sp. SYSU D00695]